MRYAPKPGDVLPNWDQPVEPYVCTDSGPTYGGKSSGAPDYKANWDEAVTPKTFTERASVDTPDGDNPSNYSLPQFGNGTDPRKYGGSSNSNPTPGKTGA
jgi:hypothetical protein